LSAEEFIIELSKKRPDLEDKKNEQTLKDILEQVKKLTPETRFALLDAYVNYYKIARTPTWADLLDCAEKAKIKIRREHWEVFFYVCQICKTAYPLYSSGCPVCKKKTEVKVGQAKKMPDNFKRAHEDCWACVHYGRYSMGPGCKEFAKGTELAVCPECICSRCCNETYLLRTNPAAYKELAAAGHIQDRRR